MLYEMFSYIIKPNGLHKTQVYLDTR